MGASRETWSRSCTLYVSDILLIPQADLKTQIASPLAGLLAPRTLPEHLVLLSTSGVLSLSPSSDLTLAASLPPTSIRSTSQTLHLYPTASSSLLPAAIQSLIPSSSKAHLAFVVRTSAAQKLPAESLVEISKTKFEKKAKRPSSAAVIQEADEKREQERLQCQIELALLDPEVMRDGVVGMGIVSLGKVHVKGSQVVVSEDGFVSLLCSFRSSSLCKGLLTEIQ